MMHSVASSPIDDRTVGHIFSVVYEDSPDIDKAEERNVGELLEWKDEWEEVVRK